MKKMTAYRNQTAQSKQKEKYCSLYNIRLTLTDLQEGTKPSVFPFRSPVDQQNKQNVPATDNKLLFVPSLKCKSSDRIVEQPRNSTVKFKDLMRSINFFNIKPVRLERRPSQDSCHKKMLVISGNSTKITPFRRSLNFKELPIRLPESINSDTFESKLKQYHQLVREVMEFHNIKKCIPHTYQISCRAAIKPGNNSKLIRFALKRRWWWSVTDNVEECNFVWSQLRDRNIFIDGAQASEKVHNHLEHNYFLGNKKCLFYNMKTYYQQKGLNPFNYLPMTFHIRSLDDPAYLQFVNCYNNRLLEKQKPRKPMWIVKPAENTNRGRGITIHNDLSEISQIISSNEKHSDGSLKTYIVQIYIEKPFLYNRRKFDIRCYMLVSLLNNSVKGYWYQNGYIRTSSDEFELNSYDPNIHLTNDAIQKHSQTYGKFEAGNKLSFYEFEKYLQIKHNGKYNFKDIIQRMKETSRAAIESTYKTIGGRRKHGVFELFGMDFMIDQCFRPWLIEINTNPCLQTSCAVLQRIIPPLIQDILKVCLDPMFPPPREWPSSRKHEIDINQPSKLELIFDEASTEVSYSPVNSQLLADCYKDDEGMD